MCLLLGAEADKNYASKNGMLCSSWLTWQFTFALGKLCAFKSQDVQVAGCSFSALASMQRSASALESVPLSQALAFAQAWAASAAYDAHRETFFFCALVDLEKQLRQAFLDRTVRKYGRRQAVNKNWGRGQGGRRAPGALGTC